MTRSPASSTLPTPTWVQHDNADIQTVLTAAWLHNEFDLDAFTLTQPVLGVLPVQIAGDSLDRIAAELAVAGRVEACTLHSELYALTECWGNGPISEDAAEHAARIRDDARHHAAQLVDQANTARWVTA